MGFAVLLLALLPMAFLPDFLESDKDDKDQSADDLDRLTDFGDGSGEGDDHWPSDILSPVYQDDVDDHGSVAVDEENVLSPIVEDDEATPPDENTGEVLLPIDADDSETDTPPEETRTFELNITGEPVHIEGFQVGADVLHVVIDPPEDNVIPETNVELSNNGQNCLVFVGKHLVAIIKDAPNVLAQDVLIEVTAH